MNDKDRLEEMLLQSQKEANKFFSKIPYENINKAVFLKLKKDNDFVLPKKHNRRRFIAGVSVLSACFVIFIARIFFHKGENSFEKEKLGSMGSPVSQQMIKFDDEELSQWLHFFKINKPDQIDSNLLAVIWETGSGGEYKMAYSSLFEDSNKPRPVATVAFPDHQPSMFVISSQNDEKKYIHYRVLGYKENKILPYIEQNYVTGGEIEVVDGALKETRMIPKNYVEQGEGGDMSQVVTYYILYQSDEFGEITPSVEKLRIRQGEYIAIIGDESTPIEKFDSKLFLDWEMGRKVIDASKSIKFFYAENPGYEDLYIRPLRGGTSKKISVEVIGSRNENK